MNCASRRPGFSKWWGRSASKVTASPSLQLVRDAVADQAQPALQHHGGLAAAGLVHRRVVRPAGGGAGRQRVQRHLGALARQRRRQHLVAVAAGVAAEQPLVARARRVTPSPSSRRSSCDSDQLQARRRSWPRPPASGWSPRARPGTASAPRRRSARPGRAARGPSPRAARVTRGPTSRALRPRCSWRRTLSHTICMLRRPASSAVFSAPVAASGRRRSALHIAGRSEACSLTLRISALEGRSGCRGDVASAERACHDPGTSLADAELARCRLARGRALRSCPRPTRAAEQLDLRAARAAPSSARSAAASPRSSGRGACRTRARSSGRRRGGRRSRPTPLA